MQLSVINNMALTPGTPLEVSLSPQWDAVPPAPGPSYSTGALLHPKVVQIQQEIAMPAPLHLVKDSAQPCSGYLRGASTRTLSSSKSQALVRTPMPARSLRAPLNLQNSLLLKRRSLNVSST